ncbi:MAG: hypothetical protein MJE77_14545 [Proteobacteria bacterium]|nr:hypothetical protein [Pseudomonadota bacterium]
MTRVILTTCSVVLCVLSARPEIALADPVPLIIVTAPSAASDAAKPMLDALGRFARERGTVLLDLSPAADPKPQAGRHLRRSIEDYQAFRFQSALENLDVGLAEAARTGALGLSPSELSDLLIYRALVLTELGDAARAWDDFVRAVVLDPSRRLDTARFPPRATEPFARAVKQVSQAADSELTIAAPDHCRVVLDGRQIRPGQMQPVKWGEHYVHVVCPERVLYGTRVLVKGPRRLIEPRFDSRPKPTLADGLRTARKQGVQSFLWAQLAFPDGVTPTLTLALIDTSSGSERRRVIVRAGPGRENDIAGAAARLVSPDPVAIESSPGPARAWYRRPWVWGIAGATLATAILLPFAIGSDSASHFDVRLRGEVPP